MIRLRRIKVRGLRSKFKTKKDLQEYKIELSLSLNCKPRDITFTFDELQDEE